MTRNLLRLARRSPRSPSPASPARRRTGDARRHVVDDHDRLERPAHRRGAAAAGVLSGADAYFKYVNARGGVNGRKIDFTYLDDAYDPSQTVQNVRAADPAEQRLRAVLGRRHEQQPRDSRLHERAGVPQVFSAAGATTFGRDYAKYPWTIGYLPPYAEEGEIYARTSSRRTRRRRRSRCSTSATTTARTC